MSSRFSVVPIVFETYGALGERGQARFRELVRKRADRLEQEAETASHTASTFSSYWGQRIACRLQREQASLFLHVGRAAWAAAHS